MDNQKSPNISRAKNVPLYSKIFPLITEHPFIVTALISLFSISITTGETLSFGAVLVPVLIVFILGVCASVYIGMHDIKKNKKIVSSLLVIASAVVAFLFYRFVFTEEAMPFLLLNAGLGVIALVFIYFGLTNKLTTDNIILIIFAAGFLIRLVYVLYTPIGIRQHDVNSFNSDTGHAAYIRYLYENQNLPDFDVRTKWQFYHPPLHHTISAIWLKMQTAVGIDFEYACENIQILTLFYSSACIIISYKIFRQLNLKKSGLIAATAIISFCPTFFILAGSINNDMLSITFMLGAILNTIYWYKNQKLRYIVSIALCVGLGMMTKLSVWMVAPAIAFVFIYVFFKNLKSFKKNLTQFAVFGVICVPLGLWWSIRNFISHQVPFTYVPMLSEKSDQYVGDIPLLQRLFDFNFTQFTDVGDQFTRYNGSYNEYNPLVGLFKTAMFDEGITVTYYPDIVVFNKILFWSAVILGIVGFICMVLTFIKKNAVINFPMKMFIFLLYSVILVSYYIFCIKFAHVCTQNIRYAVPLIVIGAYFVGIAIQRFEDGKTEINTEKVIVKPYYSILKTVLCIITFIFSISSVLVYDIVASTPII